MAVVSHLHERKSRWSRKDWVLLIPRSFAGGSKRILQQLECWRRSDLVRLCGLRYVKVTSLVLLLLLLCSRVIWVSSRDVVESQCSTELTRLRYTRHQFCWWKDISTTDQLFLAVSSMKCLFPVILEKCLRRHSRISLNKLYRREQASFSAVFFCVFRIYKSCILFVRTDKIHLILRKI